MAALAGIAQIASLALGAVGTIVQYQAAQQQAAGYKAAAAAQNAAMQFEAKQLDMKAQEERAAAQRRAFSVRKRKEDAQSTLMARAAASGGSITDPTVVALGEGIEAEGEEQALMEFYKGENAARGLQDSATGRRMSGAAAIQGGQYAAQGARMSGMATLLSGGTSLLDRYSRMGRGGVAYG